MKRFAQLMKVIQVVCLVFFVVNLVMAIGALAQEAPAAQSASWVDVLLATMKAVMPSVIAFLAGFLTKGITYLMSLTPTPWLGIVSSAVGAFGAAATAAAEGFSVEAVQANAVVGAGSGALGHATLQAKPIEPAKPAQS